MVHLKDNFGRTFPYFRISITDVCNFKCGYCLPNGYLKPENKKNFLTLKEIRRTILTPETNIKINQTEKINKL